jgi:type IV fimbrial biogenesis protein FimT
MGTRQHGFTLWELMMAVVVAGIILSLAVPSFQDFHRSNAMAAVANDFVTGALLARSEAVKRQAPVTLCTTDDPAASTPTCTVSSGGAFVVFVDENGNGDLTDATDGNATIDGDDELVLLRSEAAGGRMGVFIDTHFVTYGANGYPRPGFATRFLFCDDRGTGAAAGGQSAARLMVLDPTGRGSIRSDVATVQAAEAALEAECDG